MVGIFKKKSFKGFLLAAFAALSVSNVYIFSKAALLVTPLYTFGFYWFLLAFSYNLALITSTGKIKLFFSYPTKILKAIVVIATFELLAAITFYIGMQRIESPSVASFLNNTTPVFVTLISIPLLNEKFNKLETIGIAVTLAGAFLLSYSGKFTLNGLFVKGANIIVFSCLLAAVGLVIAKKNIKNVDPYLLSFSRTVFLLVFYALGLFLTAQPVEVSGKVFMDIALGSFLGPFLGSILQYNAFRFIEVSKESLIQNTNGLFVIITGYLYLGIFPLYVQIIGGFITIGGVAIMVFGKLYYRKQRYRVKQYS
ncbi:MAG TPA: DMT family transporter [Bacteroidales bacterium]